MSSFDLQSIERLAGVNTVVHKHSVTSTSDVAKAKLMQSNTIPMPMLVLCDEQTAGRGQPGKSWKSNAKSLTFTWCIDASSVPTGNQALLPLIAGVSICEAIDSLGIENAKLKWPNDVLIERKKVCGILIEKISSRSQASFLIGIGINVNQSVTETEAFDCSTAKFPPASLSCFATTDFQLQNLLEIVIRSLNEHVFSKQNWQPTFESRLDFMGQQVEIKKPDGEVVAGTFRGVDETGHLKIDCHDGTVLIASGQLTSID